MCAEPALVNPIPISSRYAPTTILLDPTATEAPNWSLAAALGWVSIPT